MTLHAWHEEPIAKSHDRKKFDCGNADLNEFLQKHARQNHDSGGAKTFCAIDDADPKRVLGFYSLAPAAIGHARLPRSVTKGLPQHEIGGFKLARIRLEDSPLTLMLPLKTIQVALQGAGKL